jgi:hypothetical protein
VNGDSGCTSGRTTVGDQPAQSIAHAAIPFTRVAAGSVEGVRLISAGDFLMGTNDADGLVADGEGPIRVSIAASGHAPV